MANGVDAAGPFSIAGPSSADLATAVLDPPAVDASRVLGGADVGALVTLTIPDVVDLPGSAVYAPAGDLAWLDRIHVVPREVDLGAVLSDVEVPVEVWNAFLRRAKVLTSILVTGPAGVEVINPYALPTHYPGSESKPYTVKILAEGGARVDNLVTWVFLGIDPSGTDLHLLGLRMIPFAAEPDLNERVVEGYGYFGEVLVSDDGTEQRRQLRRIPHGWIEFTATCIGGNDPRLANALLYGWLHRPFGVPLWQYWNRLRSTLASGGTDLDVDTTDVPWTPGMLVMLRRDESTWDVGKLDSLIAGGLRLTLPVSASWPATSTLVLPLVTGFLAPEQSFDWLSLRAGRLRVRFVIPAFRT